MKPLFPIRYFRATLQHYPKTIVALCFCVFLVAGMELYFSCKYGRTTPHESFVIDFHTYWRNRPHATFYRVDENKEQIRYCYNAQGFRTRNPSAQIPLVKTADTKRIMMMGDSTTVGHGVAFENSYAEALNRRFGDQVDVFSCAVSGFSAVQCRIQLEQEIGQYEPDLITVAVNFNDRRSVLDPGEMDSEHFFYYTSRVRWFLDILSRHLACVNALMQYKIQSLQKQLEQNQPRLDELICRVPPPPFAKNLERICDVAGQKGIRVVFIGLGDSFQFFENIFAYREANNLEDKIQFLQTERNKKNSSTYGLATLLLVDLIRQNGIEAAGLDPDSLLNSGQTVVSAFGGFLIQPDWIYREVMQTVAETKGIPYFDFVSYARGFDEIDNGGETIFIRGDLVHLNAKGHQLLADGLYPILADALDHL
jgi:lysophospholipase L1-like esterase